MSLIAFDRDAMGQAQGIVGVDEAGRGPLAGAVVAAAVVLDRDFYTCTDLLEILSQVNDSKKLTAAMREHLFDLIGQWQCQGRVGYGLGRASVQEIEAHNILGATRMAMARALQNVQVQPDACASWRILVDGRPLKPFAYPHKSVVKGDGKSLAIAMASIIAKVTRDRDMCELDARYPAYGFAIHKGYGTVAHREALRAHGPCPEHRALFLRKILGTDT